MCGVGTAPNCVYGPDGKGSQSHANEDGHLRFRWETKKKCKNTGQVQGWGDWNCFGAVTPEALRFIIVFYTPSLGSWINFMTSFMVIMLVFYAPLLRTTTAVINVVNLNLILVSSHKIKLNSMCVFPTNQRRGRLFPVWGFQWLWWQQGGQFCLPASDSWATTWTDQLQPHRQRHS